MVAFTKVADFTEDCMNGAHNLNTGIIKLALSNVPPASETANPLSTGNGVLANVTQVAYTNIVGGQPTLDNTGVSQSNGTATLASDDEVIAAAGGAVATWQYVYVYNDTAASDQLIGMYDNGSPVNLGDGESVTVRFSVSGICSIT